MKILEIHIGEFGCLKDRQFFPSRGLNVFEGQNETGKSTLWLFVKFMLYGLPRKGQEERARSISRDGHCAKGSMRVSAEGEDFLIERSFVEGSRSGTERLTIRRCADGAEVYHGQQPGEVFLQVPKDVFESSCGIGQTQCGALGGRKSVEAIRNLLSTADENVDVSRIEEKLNRIRILYRHKSGKGGRLTDMNEELNRLKRRQATALETHGRLEQLRERLDRDEAQVESLRKEQRQVGELLSQIGILQILQRFDALEKDRQTLEQIQRELREHRRAYLKTDRVPTATDVAILQSLTDQAQQAQERSREIEAEKRELVETNLFDEFKVSHGKQIAEQGGAEALIRKMSSMKGRRRLLGAVGAVAVVLGAASLLVPALPLPIRIGVAAGVATLGLLSLLLSFWTGRRVKALAEGAGASASVFEEQVRACEEAYVEQLRWEDQKARLESDLRLAETYFLDSLSRLTQKIKETLPMEDKETSVTAAREEIRRLTEFHRGDRELSQREALLIHHIREESERLSEYDEATLRGQVTQEVATLSPQEIQRAELSRKLNQSRLDTLEISLKQRRIEEISLGAGAEDPMLLGDEIARHQEELSRAEEYAESLELALSSLRQAADTMSGSITPALSEAAGAMMRRISAGRYDALRTGNELTPTLFSQEGQSVSDEMMSGGTRDAAYLCLRIALMTQVFSGEIPPLMMDEALCQMDDERTKTVLELLGGLCADGLQCFLFTCHEREARICRERGISFEQVRL